MWNKQIFFISFCAILIPLIYYVQLINYYPEEDYVLDFRGRVVKYGYSVSEYNVTSEDGYICTVFQVINPNCKKIVDHVFMLHGFMMNSIGWLDSGPENSILLLLVRDCHEVWIGTNRGSYYGRNHVTLNPDTDQQFWDYYLDDIAKFDLPVQIDYALNHSDIEKINYIGYSQGGAAIFVLLSESQLYRTKFNKIIALSPPTRLIHTKSVTVRNMFSFLANMGSYVTNTGEVFKRQSTFISVICKFGIMKGFCTRFFGMIDTHHPGSISDYTVQLVTANFPDSVSLKLAEFYYQTQKNYEYKKYDYGRIRNLEVYGTAAPPDYDLSKIMNEVFVIYGLNDCMTDPKDVEWAIAQIPNAKSLVVNNTEWNHFDMVLSQFVHVYVYQLIKDVLSNNSTANGA